jgi:hypothetical protein
MRDCFGVISVSSAREGSAPTRAKLSQNLVSACSFCRMQSVQEFMASEKAVTTEFKRRQETPLNVEIKRSKGDAQESRSLFGAYEFRFHSPKRLFLNRPRSVRKSSHLGRTVTGELISTAPAREQLAFAGTGWNTSSEVQYDSRKRSLTVRAKSLATAITVCGLRVSANYQGRSSQS